MNQGELPGDPVAEELAAITRELYARGALTSIGGNVSARVAPGAREAWITPKQVFKGGLTASMLVKIDLEGEPVGAGPYVPSSERRFHAAILRARPDVNAVVHGHAVHATALALAKLPVRPITTEAAFLGEVPVLPYFSPGSRELADAVEKAYAPGVSTVLLENHGFIAAAASLRTAANLAGILEHTAEILLLCHGVGRAPEALDARAVAEIRKAYG